MPLDDYGKKRDFRRTPEPPGELIDGRPARSVFVVHKHDARALHWDLRIEVDGVLWSFAVPKGFSYNPKDKHLAVRTEDHPIEYEEFHGVIPKGQYGAGAMTIWDRGTFEWTVEPDPHKAVAKGEIKIILYGRKLRGEWHLVKTAREPNHWLLFKSKDRFSGPDRDSALGVDLADAVVAPFPGDVALMTPAPEPRAPFSDPDWVFEMRFAGRRALLERRGERVDLRGPDATPEGVVADVQALRCDDALLDGVLLALDERGRPDRATLDDALAGRSDSSIVYYAFDLLQFDEFDLRPMPLVDRKGALRAIVPELDHLLFVDHVAGNGESLADAIKTAGLPGMIAKRAGSTYVAGASDDWLEVPIEDRHDELSRDGSAAKSHAPAAPASSRVKLTNLSKVYWPAEGYTKGDLLHYYEQVSELLLPYLKDRPVHMNRFPDGIEGKAFYQRHATETTPKWVRRVRIHSDSKDEEQDYILCDDVDTLLCMINLGSIDLHPWMSRHHDFEHPDYAVLDLDPKVAPFSHVIELARIAGRILHDLGLRPCLKTSGKTGLHIFLPLLPNTYTYEHVRMFLEGVARAIVRERPDICTVERVVGNREGKVYLDFLQNGKGQTVVPPYVARPTRGACVSTPLRWDELTDDLTPHRFNIQTVPRRLDDTGDLFAGVLDDPQDLMPAIERLADLISGS